MKWALLSDIHANIQALSACEDHARRHGAERWAVLGDLVGYGADPVWVVDTVMALVQAGAVAVLTDPDQIARLTPFLHSVKEEGEHWVWQLTKVPVLGASFSFTFRERMDFDEPHRIDFTHDPAPGAGPGRARDHRADRRPAPHLEDRRGLSLLRWFFAQRRAGGVLPGHRRQRRRADIRYCRHHPRPRPSDEMGTLSGANRVDAGMRSENVHSEHYASQLLAARDRRRR